jgi:hypothetical protein
MFAKTSLKVVCCLAFGVAGAMLWSGAAEGTPEIAQKEGLGCLVCHTAVGRAELNDRGTYYRAERTLEDYRPPQPAPAREPGAEAPPEGGEETPEEPDPAPEPATERPR